MTIFQLTSCLIHRGLAWKLYGVGLLDHLSAYFWRFTDRSWIDDWLLEHLRIAGFLCVRILGCLEFLVGSELCDGFFDLITDLWPQAFGLAHEHLLQTLHKLWLLRLSNRIDYFDLDYHFWYLRDVLHDRFYGKFEGRKGRILPNLRKSFHLVVHRGFFTEQSLLQEEEVYLPIFRHVQLVEAIVVALICVFFRG